MLTVGITRDTKIRHAVDHTLHCLVGCGLGEILGMLIASALGWHRIYRIILAIILAFTLGYSLTYRRVRPRSSSASAAFKVTAATDTVSITSMEIVDSAIELIIPNALVVNASSFRFWWGLALALTLAFFVTVPVNRYMMSQNAHRHHG